MKREISADGQDVLTMGETKNTEADKRDRLRIADQCRDFYRWLKSIDPQDDPPELEIYPEAHVLTGSKGQAGFGVYLPSVNMIIIAVRGKHECTDTFEEAAELCYESVAHEYRHFLQKVRHILLTPKTRKGKMSEQEEDAESYARKIVKQYLSNAP
jgi:predicted metalloprotease